MFNWFRKKTPRHFSDNKSAFAHACKLGYRPLIGALIPALLVEEGEYKKGEDHQFLIRLALTEGPRQVWCPVLKEARGVPSEGDLVGFRVVLIASDLPEDANLIGYIACRLLPIFVEHKGWVIGQNYTPPNLKPALHL